MRSPRGSSRRTIAAASLSPLFPGVWAPAGQPLAPGDAPCRVNLAPWRWGGSSPLHARPGLPSAHFGNGLRAPSASCRPHAQCLVSITRREYPPLLCGRCRGWGGGASPSMLLHSREKNTKGKKKKKDEEEKKSPEKLLFIVSTKSQLFREVKTGRGTLQPRKHGSVTGQEATAPLPAFLAAGRQRAGVAMAVTKPPPALFPPPASLCPGDAAPPTSQGP